MTTKQEETEMEESTNEALTSNDFYAKDAVYDVPSSNGGYMRFEEGENKFRILGKFSEGTAIQGFEYWKTVEGKRTPIRLRRNADGSKPEVSISELEINKFGQLDMPKHFWILPVWNYRDKAVQLLEITQKNIIRDIQKYIANPKWGNPDGYDFIVTKGKPNDKPLYTVTVDPKEPIATEILDQYTQMVITMDKIFDGGDPFMA